VAGLETIDAGLPGAVSGFTTRAGGVSAPPWDRGNLALHVGDDPDRVGVNRQALAQHLGVPAVSFPHQVHGSVVQVVGPLAHSGDGGSEGWPEADAFVTAAPAVALGVLVADCVPVLLADARHGVIGAAHAGRRGLAQGVVQATVAAMVGLGAEPESTSAVVGPAICGRCYEVPEAMRDEVDLLVPGSAAETAAGTASLDLPTGAAGVLRAAGIDRVAVSGLCTATDDRFFSYRRDGVTGRFAGFVMRAPR
jgi:hypothetical protein